MGPTGPTDPSQTSLGHCLGQGLAQAHPYPPGNKEVMGGLQGAVLGGSAWGQCWGAVLGAVLGMVADNDINTRARIV